MLSDNEIQRLRAQLPSALMEATVLDPPVDVPTGFMRVEIDNRPGVVELCPFGKIPNYSPRPKDAALVAESDGGHFWVVQWWGQGVHVSRPFPDFYELINDLGTRLATLEASDDANRADIANLFALVSYGEPDRLDFGTPTVVPSGVAAGGEWELLHTDGTPRRFVLTPPLDCWLEVGFHTIVIVNGAAAAGWGRIDSYIVVTPTPPVLPGQQAAHSDWGRDVKYDHVGLPWVGLESKTRIPLVGGVEYTFKPFLSNSGGGPWDVYHGSPYSWFEHGRFEQRSS